MPDSAAQRSSWWHSILLATFAAVFGVLVSMAVQDLRLGDTIGDLNSRLATISVRLTAVELQLSRITCVEAKGTNTCDPHGGG